jgi:hypothetical protein
MIFLLIGVSYLGSADYGIKTMPALFATLDAEISRNMSGKDAVLFPFQTVSDAVRSSRMIAGVRSACTNPLYKAISVITRTVDLAETPRFDSQSYLEVIWLRDSSRGSRESEGPGKNVSNYRCDSTRRFGAFSSANQEMSKQAQERRIRRICAVVEKKLLATFLSHCQCRKPLMRPSLCVGPLHSLIQSESSPMNRKQGPQEKLRVDESESRFAQALR